MNDDELFENHAKIQRERTEAEQAARKAQQDEATKAKRTLEENAASIDSYLQSARSQVGTRYAAPKKAGYSVEDSMKNESPVFSSPTPFGSGMVVHMQKGLLARTFDMRNPYRSDHKMLWLGDAESGIVSVWYVYDPTGEKALLDEVDANTHFERERVNKLFSAFLSKALEREQKT